MTTTSQDTKAPYVIYLHGFNSTGDTGTAANLRSRYGAGFAAPSYDYISPANTADLIDALVTKCMKEHKVIMVGKSLGGFWANYFAEKYSLPCVLVNPALNPATSLLKHLGRNVNFNDNRETILTAEDVRQYEHYQPGNNPALYKQVLLGGKDTIINPIATAAMMRGYSVHHYLELDHFFNNHEAIGLAIDEAAAHWGGQ